MPVPTIIVGSATMLITGVGGTNITLEVSDLHPSLLVAVRRIVKLPSLGYVAIVFCVLAVLPFPRSQLHVIAVSGICSCPCNESTLLIQTTVSLTISGCGVP